MTLRRALTGGLFGLVIAAAAPMSTASAAPADYPTDETGGLTVSATVVTVGSSVAVSGGGYADNTPVNVTTTQTSQGFAGAVPLSGGIVGLQRMAAAAAVVITDGSGSFSTSVTLNEVGTVVITATGLNPSGGTRTLSATVQVVAAGGVGGGGVGGGGDGSGAGSDGGASGVGGDGGLADTGASIRLPVTLGAIFVLGGAGLITAVRRRKRGNATA